MNGGSEEELTISSTNLNGLNEDREEEIKSLGEAGIDVILFQVKFIEKTRASSDIEDRNINCLKGKID